MSNFEVPSSSSAQKQPESPIHDATPMQIDGEEENEAEMNNSDSSCCIICIEPWKSEGHHQACCLPFGHVYCFSCIRKVIQQNGDVAKCPLCNALYTLDDVRKLFALPALLPDRNLEKRNKVLEAENRNMMSLIEKLLSEQEYLREEVKSYKEVLRRMPYFGRDGQ